jgi:hypothetical protein
MPFPFMAVGAGISALGSLGKIFAGAKQNKLANQINPIYQQYQENPLAKENLAVNKNMFYGSDPASLKAQSNVMQAQSNQLASAQRGATDASQLLALGAGLQGGTNEAFSKLAAQEAEGKAGLLTSLGQAYRGAISEGDKAYESMLQKYQMDSQAKAALRNAGQQNIFGGIGDIGAGAMQYGMFKGMSNNAGGQGTQGLQSMSSNPALAQNILFGTGNKFGVPNVLKSSTYQIPKYP